MPNKEFLTTIDVTTMFLSDAQTVVDVRIFRNYWWLCEDGDPKKAVFYDHYSPRCNRNRSLVEKMASTHPGFENLKVIQIPIAYVHTFI